MLFRAEVRNLEDKLSKTLVYRCKWLIKYMVIAFYIEFEKYLRFSFDVLNIFADLIGDANQFTDFIIKRGYHGLNEK